MGTIDCLKFVLTQSALDALCEKFYIPDVVYPELPGPNARIRNSPTGNFRIFYINSKNKGWMCFSKRAENAPVCYTRPLDSLKNWNDHFFWVDASVLPHAISWHSSKTMNKDPHPIPDEFDADVCIVLRSRKMDLFAFIRHADPTKVKIGDSEGVGNDNVNKGSGGVAAADQTEQSGPIVRIGGLDIEVDVEAQALVADKPKKFRKRKTVDGASGSGHPPKRLREDHDTFGDVCASTAGKTLAALQDLLDKSTLVMEIGVTTATTVPFVTSSVTPTPEHEGGEYTDSVSAANFRTKHSAGRFVISSDTPNDSNVNAADDEVSSVVMFVVTGPVVLTTVVATTVIVGTSVPQPKEVNEPTCASIFADSTSAGNVGPDVAKPSQPAGNDISSESFYVSLDMDSETLHHTYVPKRDVLNESVLDEPNLYRSLVDQLAPPVFFSQLSAMEGKKRLEGKCGMQANLLKEMDTEIAGLKAQLSLKEAEVVEAIRLHSRIADVKASNDILTGELKSLKKRNLSYDDLSIKASTLECKKDKLVDHVLILVFHSLIFVALLNYAIIILILQVSELETTCSRLRDEVAGCKLCKEHVEVVHDEQVKALSDRVAHIDYDLMDMALHMDEEFYLCYLKTIAGRSQLFFAVDDLRAVKFPLLSQLESRKDASMADIFDLLRLEGPAAETLEASRLQPSFEMLMVPIHLLEDQVVIGETSLSFALDELTGEASTSMVSSTAVTTLLSTTFVQASTIPSVPSTEVPPSPKIVFEEELDTMPEHALDLLFFSLSYDLSLYRGRMWLFCSGLFVNTC
uniref:Transposase (Putative), gypsy type n=1 Tax=Tanacetum cinerariifolium TaxID=118510 RepID=A0A699HJY8_TANCI|nr:hypothetical protein [Tanacetum cinerariifolium]